MPLKSPFYVEVFNIKDFGRLVCALERAPLPAFSLSLNRDLIFAVQTDIINDRPVIYFVKNQEKKDGQYSAYRLLLEAQKKSSWSDSVVNPTFFYSPIINIDKFPPTLMRSARGGKKVGYIPIRLKDLSSLAKVAAYKTIYEITRPYLCFFLQMINPIITISQGSQLARAMSLSEADSISYFYYLMLNEYSNDLLSYVTRVSG